MSEITIKIAKQYYYNNAEMLLKAIKVGSKPLSDSIEEWLKGKCDLKPKYHNENNATRLGYDAAELNKVLRQKMSVVNGVHGEATVEDGILLHHGKVGFDFSLFDEKYYKIKLRNSYMGDPGRFKGDERVKDFYKRVINEDGTNYKKAEWVKWLQDNISAIPGENEVYEKQRYTVVGEIQFGNWALARHDMLRLLNSAAPGEIDFYIYIAATGKLEKSLSSGIVSFDGALSLFNENLSLLRTPIWVIGIDIE